MAESLHIVITVTAIVTDPDAVSTTDVTMITNIETGATEPFIPSATELLKSALTSAVGQKLRDMPGVKFGACSAQPWPSNDDGSYAPIPPPTGRRAKRSTQLPSRPLTSGATAARRSTDA